MPAVLVNVAHEYSINCKIHVHVNLITKIHCIIMYLFEEHAWYGTLSGYKKSKLEDYVMDLAEQDPKLCVKELINLPLNMTYLCYFITLIPWDLLKRCCQMVLCH